MTLFWQNQKFLKLEKLENIMKECFIDKKRFHLFKSLLHKNQEAQNMPMVAGRLVSIFAANKFSKMRTPNNLMNPLFHIPKFVAPAPFFVPNPLSN